MPTKLHPRNRHNELYDFNRLINSNPELQPYLIKNKGSLNSIDFSNPNAVLQLNKALLMSHYDITFWDLPSDFLCPAVPGRADYIHYAADLFGKEKNNLTCLDIGTGANCIYPIIAVKEYNWKMVGTEIDTKAFKIAEAIIGFNPNLTKKVNLRFQPSKENILKGIIIPQDQFDLIICNPPFYNSEEQAQSKTVLKNKNLKIKSNQEVRNFSGRNHELVTEGGEVSFILKLIKESSLFKNQVKWYTTLVSSKDSLKSLQKALRAISPSDIKIISMSQGKKSSRILAWKY